MAQSLGIAPTPDRARFVAELARLTHPSSEGASMTRARAAASLHRSPVKEALPAGAVADTVPIPLTVEVWSRTVFRRSIAPDAIVAAILADPQAAHLCHGLAAVDDETLQYLADHPAILTRLYEHDAAVFARIRRQPAHSREPRAAAWRCGRCRAVGGRRRRKARPAGIIPAPALRAGRRTPGVSVRHHRGDGCAAGGVRTRPVDRRIPPHGRSGSKRWPQ